MTQGSFALGSSYLGVSIIRSLVLAIKGRLFRGLVPRTLLPRGPYKKVGDLRITTLFLRGLKSGHRVF